MDPDSTIDISVIATASVLLLLAFIYSLINRVFHRVYAYKPEDVDDVYSKVEAIVDSRDFREIVSQGSFFPCLIAAIILGLELASDWYLWVAILAGIYFFAYFIPEILATKFQDTLSKFCINAYKILKYAFWPTSKVSVFFQDLILSILGYDKRLSFLPESMREAMNYEEDSVLEEEEKQMIRNIFVLGDTPVRKIMTPRVEMHAIDVQTPLPDVINLLNGERFSRLPVYSGSIDNIIGILSNRRFLEWYTTEHQHETFDLEKLARPAIFVPAGKKIDALLQELRECNSHIAIVVDEYGGTAGLATMEDILEEIVGEIGDEDDDVKEEIGIVKLPTGQYLLDPLITLSDIENKLDIRFEVEDNEHIETLSGLIQHALGSLPEAGTSVNIQDYSFKVNKMDGTKMEEVLMEKI